MEGDWRKSLDHRLVEHFGLEATLKIIQFQPPAVVRNTMSLSYIESKTRLSLNLRLHVSIKEMSFTCL